MEDFNRNTTDVVTGVDTVKKGKGKLIAGIAAGVVVTAGVGGVIAYNTSDYVKNQVKLAVSSPASYYTWVTEKNTDDFAKQIGESYRTSLEQMKSGQTTSLELKYEPSDYIKEELADSSGGDFYDIIMNVDTLSVGLNASSKESLMAGNIFAELNDKRLATFDMAADASAMEAFFRLSELSEQWIDAEIDDISDELYYDYDDKEEQAVKKFLDDPESIISPEELETEVAKYMGIWNECISDIELEKKADVDIADITVNYTVVSVEITEEKANEITEKFIATAREDEILKGILIDKLGVMTLEEYNEELDDILDELKDDTDLSSDTVILDTYIDPTGCIRGVSFTGTGDIDETGRFIFGKDGNEVRGEFVATEDGKEVASARLSATEENKVYNGSVEIISDGESVSVDFTDLECVDEEKCYFNGNLKLTFPEDEDIPPISLSFTSGGANQTVSFPLTLDGDDYGVFTLGFSFEIGADPTMPSKDGAFIVTEDSDAQISDYVEQEQMEKFLTELFQKIGFNVEDSEEYAKNAADDIYNVRTYDDYDYDYDYNYDWDDDIIKYDDDDSFFVDDTDDKNKDKDKNNDKNTDKNTDKDTSVTDDDDDFDFGDFDYDEYDLDDYVYPEDGQAFIMLYDRNYGAAELMYTKGCSEFADVTKDGTYTVKTKVGDLYKEKNDNYQPDSFAMLVVEIDGIQCKDDVKMDIKSLKIDGKEVKMTATPNSEYDEDWNTLYTYLYYVYADAFEGEDFVNVFDGANYGEWSEIEITFDIKGLK